MLLTMQPRVASNQDFSNFSTLVGKWTLLPSSSEDNTSKAALALMHLLWLLLWEEPSTDAYKDCTAAAEGRDMQGVAAVVVLLFLAGDAALLEVSDFSSEAKQKTEKNRRKKRNKNLWQSRNPFETSSDFVPSRQRSCTASKNSLHNSLHRRSEFSTSGGLKSLLKTILAAESQGFSKSANVLLLRSLPHHFQSSADPGTGRPSWQRNHFSEKIFFFCNLLFSGHGVECRLRRLLLQQVQHFGQLLWAGIIASTSHSHKNWQISFGLLLSQRSWIKTCFLCCSAWKMISAVAQETLLFFPTKKNPAQEPSLFYFTF